MIYDYHFQGLLRHDAGDASTRQPQPHQHLALQPGARQRHHHDYHQHHHDLNNNHHQRHYHDHDLPPATSHLARLLLLCSGYSHSIP